VTHGCENIWIYKLTDEKRGKLGGRVQKTKRKKEGARLERNRAKLTDGGFILADSANNKKRR